MLLYDTDFIFNDYLKYKALSKDENTGRYEFVKDYTDPYWGEISCYSISDGYVHHVKINYLDHNSYFHVYGEYIDISYQKLFEKLFGYEENIKKMLWTIFEEYKKVIDWQRFKNDFDLDIYTGYDGCEEVYFRFYNEGLSFEINIEIEDLFVKITLDDQEYCEIWAGEIDDPTSLTKQNVELKYHRVYTDLYWGKVECSRFIRSYISKLYKYYMGYNFLIIIVGDKDFIEVSSSYFDQFEKLLGYEENIKKMLYIILKDHGRELNLSEFYNDENKIDLYCGCTEISLYDSDFSSFYIVIKDKHITISFSENDICEVWYGCVNKSESIEKRYVY